MLSNSSTVEEVNAVVDSINFLDKEHLHQSEAFKQYAEEVTTRVKACIRKSSRKAEFIFSKMQDYINSLDFSKIRDFNSNDDKCTQTAT